MAIVTSFRKAGVHNTVDQLDLDRFRAVEANYIKDIVRLTEKKLGQEIIKAVIIFGSVAQRQTCHISDVDLLLIVDDSITSKSIRSLIGYLRTIEIKHGFAQYPDNIFATILNIVESTTGMFRSFFIARESDWMKGKFAQIFGTNQFFTKILAPDQIVLNSVICGSRVIFGDPKYISVRFPISFGQILKSILMDLTISIGTLAILPLNPKNMKYVLEAFKWALRSGFFYLFEKTEKLNKIELFFIKLGFSQKLIDKLNIYRTKLKVDLAFALSIPYQIVNVHTLSLKYKKIILGCSIEESFSFFK
jgi:predicted nucleotidyltransferase